MFSQRLKFTHLVFSFTALLCLLAVVSHSAVSITSVDVISPNDNTTPLSSIDARGAVDDSSVAPGTGLVRVEFSDGGCGSTVNDYFVTFKAKAQDESEYTLVNFKQNGEGGTYSAMYLLNVYSLGGCNYRADYEWNPTDSQALGFYDIYAYVVDDINGTIDESLYGANTDTVELAESHLPGPFVDSPAITSVTPSDTNIDNDASTNATNIVVPFTDFDVHAIADFDITVKVLFPDGITERTILSGSHGSFSTYGTDGGSAAVVDEVAFGEYTFTFTAWDPEDSPNYPLGAYEIYVSIKDPDGLASVSDFDGTPDFEMTTNGTTAYPTDPPIIGVITPNSSAPAIIAPGASTGITVNFTDADGASETYSTLEIKVRSQNNSSEFACTTALGGGGGGNYTATCTFDSTGKPLGWYDIYFNAQGTDGNGDITTFEENREAFKVASTLDVISTLSTEWLIDRQPDNDVGDFTPIFTTFNACFSDTWTGNYYVTLKVREPDNSSEIILANARTSGSGGVTISQADGACSGDHLITFDWTPTATDPEGYYDLSVSVYDGAAPSDVATSGYNENADTVLVQIDPVGSPPFPFNDSPTVGAVSTNPVTGIQVAGTNTIDISASFQDEDLEPVSSYGVNIYLRAPDNSTVYNLMVDQASGSSACADGVVSTSCVLNVISNGDGTYDLTLTWDPKDTLLPLGWYDVKIVVTDGIGSGGETPFDANANLVGVEAAAGGSPPPGSLDITATSATPASVVLESGTPVVLKVNFSDTLDSPGTYTYVYKVRDANDGETTITCAATSESNVGTSYESTCDWLPTGLEVVGPYDIYVSVDNILESVGDLTDFDENIGKFQLAQAVNKAPNNPTAITQYLADGVTPLAVGGFTNNPTIVFEADMTDQNALDDLNLEIEYQDTTTGFTTFPTFTCLADAIHQFTTGTPVTGTVTCDTIPDGYYHWQAHTVDWNFLESSWVSYGGNADPGDADFIIDTVAPAVISTVPANFGEMDVSDSIIINFSPVEGIDCSSLVNDDLGSDSVTLIKVSDSSFTDVDIDSCTDGDNSITLTPLVPLVRLSQYTVTLTTDVADMATNTMAGNYVFTVLASTPNQAPLAPASLTQYKIGGIIPIAVGGYTNETEVVFKGDMTDGNTVDDLTLELEYQLTVAGFADSKTISCSPDGIHPYTGTAVTGEISCDSLPDGRYHWQAKVVDFDFAESAWTSYGGNADPGDADFIVDTVAPAVISTVPLDSGEMDVDGSIVINFSAVEGIDCSSFINDDLGSDSVTLIKGSDSSFTDVDIDSCTDGDNSVTLTPITSLVRLSTYTVTLTTDVADMATNNMLGIYVFTVIASSPNQAPLIPASLTQYKLDGVTVIPTGGYTDEASVIFRGDMTDGNTVDEGLTLEVERLSTVSGFVDTETGGCAVDTPHPYAGSAVTGEVTCGSLTSGSYHWQAKVVDFDSATSAWTSYGGNADPGDADFIVDLVPPTVDAPSLDPPNGGEGSRAQNITINFLNGPIDCTGLTVGSGGGEDITVTGAGAGASLVSCTDTQIVIDPVAGNLTDGVLYTTTVTTAVKDKAGNPFAAPSVSTFTARIWETIVGAVTAAKAAQPDSNDTINVSMPYTGDANDTSTYTVKYKLASEPVTWTTHPDSPAVNTAGADYTVDITGLTEGETYDVELIFNDADGVTGTNPTTFEIGTAITLDDYRTTTGTISALINATNDIEVTIPWTFDDNNDNHYTVGWDPDNTAPCAYSSAVVHQAGPSFVHTINNINGIYNLVEGETYVVCVTYIEDTDGIAGGTNPQSVTDLTVPYLSTSGGVATAAQTNNTTIAITMPYTNDGNGNNTYKVRYRENAGAWQNQAIAGHVGSPYITSYSALNNLSTYDVEMVFIDPDGVTVNEVTTITVYLNNYQTAAGVYTASSSGATSIDVTMNYTGDDNTGPTNNTLNTYKVRYRINPAGGWTTGFYVNDPDGAANIPLTGLIPGNNYDIEMLYIDSDGVTGTNPETILNVPLTVLNLLPADVGAVTGSSAGEIDFSMPYTGDDNDTGTFLIEHRTPAGSGGWILVPGFNNISDPVPGSGLLSGTLTGLGDGEQHEFRFTYSDGTDSVDTANVTGNINPQFATATTITNGTIVPSPDSVAVQAVGNGTAIDVTINWTGDDNTDNSYTIEYRLTSGTDGDYVPWAGPHNNPGSSPYDDSITGLAGGETYNVRVTYIDTFDGVTGGPAVVISGVLTSDSPPTRVSDLTVNTTYARGLGLIWTAPTDELGAAASYDIRYIDAEYAPEEFAASSTDPIPSIIWAAMTEVPAEPMPIDITTDPPPASILQYGAISCKADVDGRSCVTTGEGKKALWPNTLYYVGMTSIDAGGKVSDVSNNTETLGDVAGLLSPYAPSHTGPKYGWNAISVPYQYDGTTFSSMFDDDQGNAVIYKLLPVTTNRVVTFGGDSYTCTTSHLSDNTNKPATGGVVKNNSDIFTSKYAHTSSAMNAPGTGSVILEGGNTYTCVVPHLSAALNKPGGIESVVIDDANGNIKWKLLKGHTSSAATEPDVAGVVENQLGDPYYATKVHVSSAATEPGYAGVVDDAPGTYTAKFTHVSSAGTRPGLGGTVDDSGGDPYVAIRPHRSSALTEPGAGADWEDYWAVCGTAGGEVDGCDTTPGVFWASGQDYTTWVTHWDFTDTVSSSGVTWSSGQTYNNWREFWIFDDNGDITSGPVWSSGQTYNTFVPYWSKALETGGGTLDDVNSGTWSSGTVYDDPILYWEKIGTGGGPWGSGVLYDSWSDYWEYTSVGGVTSEPAWTTATSYGDGWKSYWAKTGTGTDAWLTNTNYTNGEEASWTNVPKSSGLSDLPQSAGFYIYGYSTNSLDEPAGMTRNTTAWTNVEFTNVNANEFNLVGNPYLKNVSLNAVVFCEEAVDPSDGSCGGASGGYDYYEAVSNNWILSTIYYESTETTAPKMLCNSTCCDGLDDVGAVCSDNDNPPAKLRPWWGNWIQNGSSPTGAIFYMGVPKPSGLVP